jgi:hypothetical protein
VSTVAEITNALGSLTDEQLQQVEQELHAICRQRRSGIIYDDAYGVWTEEDQASVAREAFTLLEQAEKGAARGKE